MLQSHDQPTPPAAASTTAVEETDELFERDPSEHVDAQTLDRVLAALLSRYPKVPVVAFQPDGMFGAVPDSIPLKSNPVLTARSGLDLVIAADRMRMLETWDRVLADGAARCLAHLASSPGETVVVCGLDLRERHGIVLVVLIPTETYNEAPAEPARAPDLTPRFASMGKDERSFILEIDDALTKILGWSVEEMVGHRSIEFIHPDDHALAIDNWMEMLTSPGPGRRVRLRHLRRDGSWVWFEVTNHNLLAQLEGRVVSDIVDISEEMAAHEALRAREQLLDRLASVIPVGLFQVDDTRHIVYTNERLHEILGVGRVATAEEQLATVVEGDRPSVERALDEVLVAGRSTDIELELCLAAGGDRSFCAVNLRPLSHEDGTISGAIVCVSDVTELKRRATFDELTGCYNRASIMRALQADIDAGRSAGERAVMFVDLDRFKEINDRHGHAAGDELLRVVSARLRAAVREGDLVGRIGGDEFLVICPNVGSDEGATSLAERLASSLHKEVSLDAGQVQPTVSIGVAVSHGQDTDGDALVAQADSAMYHSKRQHGGVTTRAAVEPELGARRQRSPRPPALRNC